MANTQVVRAHRLVFAVRDWKNNGALVPLRTPGREPWPATWVRRVPALYALHSANQSSPGRFALVTLDLDKPYADA
jgi:hypothetical protein